MVCPSTERAHARRDTKESFMVREVLVVESRYNEKTGGLDVNNPSHHRQVPSIYTGRPGRGGDCGSGSEPLDPVVGPRWHRMSKSRACQDGQAY